MSDLSPASCPAIPPIFDARRQEVFCDALAISGNVRRAAAAACISPQTAYRTRHAAPDFARLWDAALLCARSEVEQVLADRALNGVEEQVFYHGEEVAMRRRYDSRLLLAYLARLDQLAEQAQVRADAAAFTDGMARLEAGEPLEPAIADVGVAQMADDLQEEEGDLLVERALRWLEQQRAERGLDEDDDYDDEDDIEEDGEEDDGSDDEPGVGGPQPGAQICPLNPVPSVPAIENLAENSETTPSKRGTAIAGDAP